MNEKRRKSIAAVSLAASKIADCIERLQGMVEALQEEEQEYYDNMPEGLQAGEKGSAAQDASDALGSAVDCLVNAGESLAEATGHLDSSSE